MLGRAKRRKVTWRLGTSETLGLAPNALARSLPTLMNARAAGILIGISSTHSSLREEKSGQRAYLPRPLNLNLSLAGPSDKACMRHQEGIPGDRQRPKGMIGLLLRMLED